MNKRFFPLFFVVVSSYMGWAYCMQNDQASVQDQIIGSTFKALAKTYILTADLEKLKKTSIVKLENLEEEKFRFRYRRIFAVIAQSPSLQSQYGFSADMDQQQMINKIKPLTKKKICDIIDLVPDQVIAREFSNYLNESQPNNKGRNLGEQINAVWSDITSRLQQKNRQENK